MEAEQKTELNGDKWSGVRFSKNLMTNLRKTCEKSDLLKTLDEHVITKKSYKNLMKNLGQSYAKLMNNLRRHFTL